MGYLQTGGLTNEQAQSRLLQYGENVVFHRRRMRPLILFFNKLNSPLSLILIGASILSYFLGERSNAVIILLMVLVSAVLDFINSYHSEKAVEQLEEKVATTIKVRRDGREQEIQTRFVVPGDILCLEAGDVVPADAALISAKDLYVDQSSLTGESFPIEKAASSNPQDQQVAASNPHSLMMGTNIISGLAEALTVQTGSKTEFGRIAERLSRQEVESDFERGIKNFSFFIMRLTFVMVIFVFFANALFGRGVLESFLFAVAIAIGLTPELLPVIMSVSLSRGSVEMAKKEVVVKKLSSIQNLGSMNVLCTDKTGTLTENKIVLVKWTDIKGEKSAEVLEIASIASHFHSGVANPLEEAVKAIRLKLPDGLEKVDEVPFDFTRRRSSVVVSEQGEIRLITRGAPETIFAVCSRYQQGKTVKPLTSALRAQAEQKFIELSNDGYRVLAIATKTVKAESSFDKKDEAEMTLVGFMAFLDPPKQGVDLTLRELEELGIGVKVITGDHELLAEKICREVGVPISKTLTGDQLSKMNDEQVMRQLVEITIFARIEPEQKERIVLLLKKSGNVVGYLGDGINDAPALKAADVGITVNNAVNVAKESADIVLLRKSLNVLKDGVIEGRKTFRNTLKYVLMGLSSNFGNVFSMSGASVFLPFLPMLPPQILLNNFLYDMSQLSLSTDEVDKQDVIRPLSWDFKNIRRYMVVFGIVSSVFDFLTFFVLLRVFHLSESQFQTSWFIESLTTQAMVILIIRTKRLPFFQSQPSGALLLNILFIVGLTWVLPSTILGSLFGFSVLSAGLLLAILGIVVSYLISVEITKRFFYRSQTSF